MSDDLPLLVFGHYFGGSARSWKSCIEALGTDFTCHAPTLPGFGGTAAQSPSLDFYADALAREARGEEWIAVGHSMSGKVALMSALKHPVGLRGIVLICPSPPTPEPMTEEGRQDSLRAWGDRAAAEKGFARISAGRLPPPLLERCVDDQLAVAEIAWRWWLEEGSRQDISDRTSTIDLPVLVITGDDDVVMGPNTPRNVAAGLSRGELIVIPGAGHLAPLERPVPVADAIRRFVAVLASGRDA